MRLLGQNMLREPQAPPKNEFRKPTMIIIGEIDCASILSNKEITKAFWVSKMSDPTEADLAEQQKLNRKSLSRCTASFPGDNTIIEPPPEQLNQKTKPLKDNTSNDVIMESYRADTQPPKYDNYNGQYNGHSSPQSNGLDSIDRADSGYEEPINPNESIIEKEIRLQREREEALANERQKAILAVQEKLNMQEHTGLNLAVIGNGLKLCSNGSSNDSESAFGTDSLSPSDLDGGSSASGGSAGALSPRSLSSPDPIPNHLHHSHSSRTMGLDAIGSNSYIEMQGRRKLLSKPLIDDHQPEDYTPPRPFPGESPVQREIRLNRERENELRLQRGLPVLPPMVDDSRVCLISTAQPTAPQTTLPEETEISRYTPERGVLKYTATSKIQKEIDEQLKREQEFKNNRFGTQPAQNGDQLCDQEEIKTENHSTRHLSQFTHTMNKFNQSNGEINHSPIVINKTCPKPISPAPKKPLVQSLSVQSQPSIGHRGLMQKFLATKGKSFVLPTFLKQHSNENEYGNGFYNPPVNFSKLSLSRNDSVPLLNGEPRPNPGSRKSTEAKIHDELKEFKQRETELRKQRMRMLSAASQPNLASLSLSCSDGSESTGRITDDDLESNSTHDQDDLSEDLVLTPIRERCLSNPNLLDDSLPMKSDKQNNYPRRRTSLIAEWEEKIQQSVQ